MSNISAVKTQSYPSYASRARAAGPDQVHDEFDNRRKDSGPDAVTDEFSHSRGDSSYSSYDSWSGGGSESTTYGCLI